MKVFGPILVLAALCVAFVSGAKRQTVTTRYFCATSANWGSDSSWNTMSDCVSGVTGKPDSDDPAVILTGKTANVTATSDECRDITVQSGATVNVAGTGKLNIRADGTNNSTITGTVYLQASGSELFMDLANHTLSGTGAIVGQADAAVIKVKSNKTLTSNITVRGRLKIVTETPSGHGNVTKFENKGTVNADTSGVLKIEGDVKDIAGAQWKVTASGAKLLWADSSSLFGDFTVSNAGTLEFSNDMSTTGWLTMTAGKAKVTGGNGANFNQ